MLIVGLTGGSGSGKGYISSYLEDENTIVIDTDRVYHEMISGKGALTDALSDEFGHGILNDNGGINRKALAGIVFSDKQKLAYLNSITHRAILDKTRQLIASCPEKQFAVVDAPLLFESGFNAECDLVIGVVAPEELRTERIIKRDCVSREAALARIRNQKEDSFFFENCDHVIVNDNRDLTSDINKLKLEMMRLYGKKEKKEQAKV